jgi:hypothetical protein
MKTSAKRRGMALPILCLFVLAIAACDKKVSSSVASDDPNRPAVIKEPAPVLVADTLQPPKPTIDPKKMQIQISPEYALMSLAMTGGDGRMVSSQFEPNATLSLPDTTIKGSVAIARFLINFSHARNLNYLERTSNVFSLADSIASDSGKYIGVSKRPGADSIVDRGSFATTWRLHPDHSWKVVADHLYPLIKPKKK